MGESEKVEEQLTEEERGIIPTRGDTPIGLAVAKLLRIHDALQARVGAGCLECNELKRERNETMRLLEKANARIEYLVLERPDQVAGLEARVEGLELAHTLGLIGAALGGVARDMGATPEMIEVAVERQRREKLYAEINDQSFDGTCPTCGQRYHPPG